MNAEKVRELVNEAVTLHRTIADMEDRLKLVKSILVVEAQNRRPDAGSKTEGGGIAVVLAGPECISRVVFPGPSLRSFKTRDAEFARVSEVAGEFFFELFRPMTTCKPVEDFRERARQLLGARAGRLIDLCERESAPTVSFEVTERWGRIGRDNRL